MNALMRENFEVYMTGNETPERSIQSMREKMDREHATAGCEAGCHWPRTRDADCKPGGAGLKPGTCA